MPIFQKTDTIFFVIAWWKNVAKNLYPFDKHVLVEKKKQKGHEMVKAQKGVKTALTTLFKELW